MIHAKGIEVDLNLTAVFPTPWIGRYWRFLSGINQDVYTRLDLYFVVQETGREVYVRSFRAGFAPDAWDEAADWICQQEEGRPRD